MYDRRNTKTMCTVSSGIILYTTLSQWWEVKVAVVVVVVVRVLGYTSPWGDSLEKSNYLHNDHRTEKPTKIIVRDKM
jgi:hypothetical protein